MNEALQDAYNLFQQGGYNGSIQDFTLLVSSNNEALNDSYNLFTGAGYNGTMEDYTALLGLKKKDETEIISESLSEDGLSDVSSEEPIVFDYVGYDPYEKMGAVNPTTYVDKKLNSAFKRIASNVSRTPIAMMEFANSVTSKFYEGSEEYQKRKGDYFSRKEFEKEYGMQKLGDLSDKLLKESEEIDKTLEQFDTSITEDILSFKLGQAGKRLFGDVIGALPSLALVLGVPGGFALLGAGEAAGKSRELQDEGFKRDIKTTANAIGTGVSEGAFELITRGLGKQAYKRLMGMNKDAAETTIKGIAKEFARGFGLEGSSEALTLGSEKALDALLLEDEAAFENAFYELMDTFLVGGFVGGPLKAGPLGIQKIRIGREKANLDKVIEDSKYDDLITPFKQDDFKVEIDLETLVNIPATENFLKATLKGQVADGKITQSEATQIIENFEESVSIFNSIPDNFTPEQKEKVIPLLKEKRDLLKLIEQTDDSASIEYRTKLANINKEIESISQTAPVEDVVTEEAEQVEKEEQVYTLPESPEERIKDFEIIDNRKQQEGIIIDEEGNGKWLLLNKKTGSFVGLKRKSDAQDELANIKRGENMFEYGEGEPLIEEEIKVDETIITETTLENIQLRKNKLFKNINNEKLSPTDRQKAFVNLIKNIQPKGAVPARNARALITKVNKINFSKGDAVKKTLDEIIKTFESAEIKKKRKEANALRSRIKKLYNKANLDATVAESAKQFATINPLLVKNLDQYIAEATQLSKGLRSSRKLKDGIVVAPAVNLETLNKYSEQEIKAEQERLIEDEKDAFIELTGKSPEELSLGEIRETIQAAQESADEDFFITNKLQAKEESIKASLKNAFDLYSRGLTLTGIDTFAGEVADLTESQKRIVKDFLNIDTNKLSISEGVKALDALVNFATNNTTGGMGKIVENYKGQLDAETAVQENLKPKEVKTILGRLPQISQIKGYAWFIKNISSFPQMIETIFKGQSNARKFLKLSSFQDVINSTAEARTIARDIGNRFEKTFDKQKPNNKNFRDSENITERGMIAFMRRTITGTSEEQSVEFQRKKTLIEQSIKNLNNNGETKKSKAYQKVYDKILKDSNTVQDVENKSDAVNLKAVEWMSGEWAKFYPELQDVNLNIYNSLLENDINYTPDLISSLEQLPAPDLDLPVFDSQEYINKRKLYDKKTGVLLPNQRLTVLNPKQYVNLNFDRGNINALRKAIINIKSAGAIQRTKGFIESKAFDKMFEENPYEKDLVTQRMKQYVADQRGLAPRSRAEEQSAAFVDKIATFGIAKALVSGGQAIKQFSPMSSTLITAGAENTVQAINQYITNPDIRKWLNDAGYAISNRGIGSEAVLDSLDDAIDKTEVSGDVNENVLETITNISRKGLEWTLKHSDVFTAKSSWLAHYFNSMKSQGNTEIFQPGFDWSTHKVNKEAADYAQSKVDREQNISDTKLQGAFYRSRNVTTRVLLQTLMPFSNFLLNLKSRMYNDVGALMSKSTSIQDKKDAAKSLGGIAAEYGTFGFMSYLLTNANYLLSDAIIKGITGEEVDEEEIEKRNENLLRGRMTTTLGDIFSPLPPLDPIIQKTANSLIKAATEKEDPFQFFENNKAFYEDLGLITLTADVFNNLKETADMAGNGVIRYTKGGEEKIYELTPEEKNLAELSLAMQAVYVAGGPAELGRIANRNIRFLKEKAKDSGFKFKELTKKEKKELGIIE